MVPKRELPESIPLHNQGLNYGVKVCELEDHVGEKGLSSNWLTKLQFANKTLASFPNCLLENI
jgi:hypothetical protein